MVLVQEHFLRRCALAVVAVGLVCNSIATASEASTAADFAGLGLDELANGEANYDPGMVKPTFDIEENVDYQGNDSGSAKAAQAELCFDICRQHEHCKAFTWNDYNGGTCWLKSSKGAVSSRPGTRSGVIDPVRPAVKSVTSTIEEGVDYSGADVGATKASQAESCFDLCRQQSGCKAFSWNDYNGGTCWLKSAKGSATPRAGTRSGVVGDVDTPVTVKPPTTNEQIEEGVDYHGNDVGSASAANAELCFGLCRQRSGCKAFSWNGYNGGTCWLKSGKGATSKQAGTRSGVVSQTTTDPVVVVDPSKPTIEEGVDYHGNDVGSATAANAEQCFDICRQRSGCKAFSWTNFNGGTCWLKSGKGAVTSNPGTRSAVVDPAEEVVGTRSPSTESPIVVRVSPVPTATKAAPSPTPGTSSTAPTPTPLPTLMTCPGGRTPISVEGVAQRFCIKEPLCSGTNANGKCPGPQEGLPFGAYCDVVRTGEYGCKPYVGPSKRTTVTYPPVMSCAGNAAGATPVSVVGSGTFCASEPVCAGDRKGNCPTVQPGLDRNATCRVIATGVFGCVLP
ncbi:hypothetical protein PINS_up006861 [Pythium insidiosum]|nr:hypothetical protein PINS_up006861 [Pythium insidiosum]